MAVIERGTLKILSKNDLKELERDVVVQEKLAVRSDIASQKIAAGSALGLPSSITRKQRKLLEKGLAGGRGEESALFAKDKSKKITKAQEKSFTAALFAKLGFGKDTDLIGGVGGPTEGLKKIAKINKRLRAQEKATKGLTKAFSKFGLLQGAAAGGAGRLFFSQGLAGVVKVFFPAAIIAMIAQTALNLWIDSYGKGGVNDPRVKVKDDVKSIVDLEFEESIISAKLYFSNSRTLKPGQETRSNTMNMRDGHSRSKIVRTPYGRA